MTEPATLSSSIPVQPVFGTNSARYSSATIPIDDALTRSGRSLVTRTTCFPSASKLRATASIRESFVPSRKKPAGSDDVSV